MPRLRPRGPRSECGRSVVRFGGAAQMTRRILVWPIVLAIVTSAVGWFVAKGRESQAYHSMTADDFISGQDRIKVNARLYPAAGGLIGLTVGAIVALTRPRRGRV